MNKVYAEYFSSTPPTRTTVQQLLPGRREADARGRFADPGTDFDRRGAVNGMEARGIAMALSLVWHAAGAELQRVEKSTEAMGSTFGVIAYGSDRARLEAAADAALEEAQRLDRMLSNYVPDSEWSEVNRSAGVRPVALSAELFQLLSDCMKYSEQSGGAFDIAVGPLMKVWGFYRGEGALPKAGRDSECSCQHGLSPCTARSGRPHGTVRPARCGTRSRRYRKRLRGGSHGRGLKTEGCDDGAGERRGEQHLRIGRAARRAAGLARRHPFTERREASPRRLCS